ncbi:MAG: Probable transmembrane protein [uncultured Paraburkholderia sp.]|uniref:FimV/HubP family polar landmark protein n=1 Tax=uncultured Paraburkholderia sp. TaxID=1822466 RepID=UPI0025937BEB|nr:FimV/HubP family polar landmark protein [uncultured Paraburkholderia sp.]CAH2902293.1 MAG: Probable transmembrane protein [uncultured Paraburkholderia sp.]CAH2936717.1 MAG: Probable transmembrane protein [uncultured Paraburkholderia sp.]
MNLRLSSLRAMFARPDTGRLAVAAALALMLAGAASSSAIAAPVDAASAPDGASVSASGTAAVSSATGGQYTVRPGQSLNDVAIAVTQSHDRATLARAARAIFDANPSAFMSHDPSRMRLGSVLNVPALDASGAVAASAAGPASVPTADNGSSSNAAVGSGASSAAPGNAAAASAAGGQSPATQAATSPAVQGSASDASSAVTSDAASSAAATAAGSQAASAASGTHVWAGSVQPSASEAAAATGASQPRAQVSSLQQLLALKNRVLMELQKHGIGKAPAAPVAPVASGTQSAGGASSAAVVPGRPGTATTTSNDTGISQTNLAIAAAVGAALVVLLTALRLGRRKRERLAQEEHAASADGIAPSGVAEQSNRVVPADEVVEPNLTDADAAAAQHAAAMAAAEHEAAEGEAAAREMSERVAAEREAEIRAAASREAEARQAAEQGAAERDTAQFAADEVAGVRETAQPAGEHEPSADFPASNAELSDDHAAPAEAAALEQPEPPPVQVHHELGAATTVASLDAAAELGADALPRAPLEPLEQVNEAWEPEPLSHRLEWDDEPLPAEPMEPLSPQPLATTAQVHDDQVDTPAQPAAADQPRVQAPADFPRDALDAFGSLDMPLPPRVESAAETVHAPESLSTQPVASQEATARQAVLPPDADEAPHAADEIAAGTAGRAAVAGLGAGNLGTAGFGALKLDFDLELPPSPAQPLPAFTPADLARIARNKLDLAAEYIELGDLAGARTLINEVIESNDPATRNDARALLSTLAPLS